MQSMENEEALSLLHFWLRAGNDAWFAGGETFDAACARWQPLWDRARAGECDDWAATAAGSLALVIVLDQIPRNIFRGTADAFASDAQALAVAEAAVEAGHDRSQAMPVKNFYYLPFQHSEDLRVQERGLDLYRLAGDDECYKWALIHYDAVRRFGRFPHRNKFLGRQTTVAEAEYLTTGGFGG